MRLTGNTANVEDIPRALTPEQLYKIGAEALGWNNSTTAGKALIAEDMKLLKRLQLAHTAAISTDWTKQASSVDKICTN